MDWTTFSRNLLIYTSLVHIYAVDNALSSIDTTPVVNPLTQQTNVTSTSTINDHISANSTSITNNITIFPTSIPIPAHTTTKDFSYLDRCPDEAPCHILGAECITCKLNYYCTYGEVPLPVAECTVKQNISCTGEHTFQRQYNCRYGYQLDADQYTCDTAVMATSCSMKSAPPETFLATCRVKDEVLSLGNRTFSKKFRCNWTSGYKWSTALVLSVTLGGFGVDRFYLGLWREGIGKFFSFGGLGVWTIVDVILIAVGYVGPHDGSLYIYPWD